MNILDIFIGIIIGFCLVRGIFRGIIKETASIVGVCVGFFAAYTFYQDVGDLLSGFFNDKSHLNIFSFLFIFTFMFLAVGFVGVILKNLLKGVALGWADRLLGATFGFVKAVLIVSVLLVSLTAFLPKKSPVIKDSFLAPHLSTLSEKIDGVVPEEMKEKFGDNIKELKKTWKKL